MPDGVLIRGKRKVAVAASTFRLSPLRGRMIERETGVDNRLEEPMSTTEDGVSPGGVREDILLAPSLSPRLLMPVSRGLPTDLGERCRWQEWCHR